MPCQFRRQFDGGLRGYHDDHIPAIGRGDLQLIGQAVIWQDQRDASIQWFGFHPGEGIEQVDVAG